MGDGSSERAHGEAIVIELVAGSRMARDLVNGTAHLSNCELALDDRCELVVRTSTHQLELAAHVVAIDGRGGVDVRLADFDADLVAAIHALLDTAAVAEIAGEVDAALAALPLPDEPIVSFVRRPDEPLAPPVSRDGDGVTIDVLELDDQEPAELYQQLATGTDRSDELLVLSSDDGELTSDELDELELDGGDGGAEGDGADGERGERRIARNLHERLRGLTLAQQIKKANSPDPSERMMLERMYGKNVWEALLRNPRLTPPEVARIARMGMLPRVMLEMIVGNAGWLQVPEVRRALLSNPRLGTDQILRVLRLLPKHELKLASLQTAYPHAVRDAAKRMLRSAGA